MFSASIHPFQTHLEERLEGPVAGFVQPQLGLVVSDFFGERNAQFIACWLDFLDNVRPAGCLQSFRAAFEVDGLEHPDRQGEVVEPAAGVQEGDDDTWLRDTILAVVVGEARADIPAIGLGVVESVEVPLYMLFVRFILALSEDVLTQILVGQDGERTRILRHFCRLNPVSYGASLPQRFRQNP